MRTYRSWLICLMAEFDEFNYNKETCNLLFQVI